MPIWVLILDYILGIIMWTLIGRSAMNIFQREDSNFFFMKAFVKLTNPILKYLNLLLQVSLFHFLYLCMWLGFFICFVFMLCLICLDMM